MGFSVSAATAVLLVGFFITISIFSGALLPAIREFNQQYHSMKSRAVEQRHSSVAITNVSNVSWWNADWAYRKLLCINHDYIDEPLQNFPILVSIVESDLAYVAYENGGDIAFVHSNNQLQFSHEIEYFDSGTNTLIAWVNVTEMHSNKDTWFFMYYGAPTAANQQDKHGTWDSHYKAVWHMYGSIEDSTMYGNQGSKKARSEPNEGLGKIGNAQFFDGVDDYINCGNDDSLVFSDPIEGDTPLTIEAYIKFDTYEGRQSILSKWDETTGNQKREFYLFLNEGLLVFRVYQESTDQSLIFQSSTSLASLPDYDAFNHYVIVYDGLANDDSVKMYRNSVSLEVSDPVGISNYIQMEDTDVVFYMGQLIDRHGAPEFHFMGGLDEVRLSDTIRNESWIKASYASMHNPSEFLFVEKQQNRLQHTYLNITVKNTGAQTFRTSVCSLLINGTFYPFVYLQPFVYPKTTATILVNVSIQGNKTSKLVLDSGRASYFTYYP